MALPSTPRVPGESRRSTSTSLSAYAPDVQGFAAAMGQTSVRRAGGSSGRPVPEARKKQEHGKTRNNHRDPSGIWPQYRVGRHIRMAPEAAGWEAYTVKLASNSEGTGRTRAADALYVEYFSAVLLAEAFDKKFGEIIRDKSNGQGRANTVTREIFDRLNDYAAQQADDQASARHLQSVANKPAHVVLPPEEAVPLSVNGHALIPPDFHGLWAPEVFKIKTVPEIVGNTALTYVLDNEGRRTMHRERYAMGQALGRIAGWGYNIAELEPDWDPRVVVFDTYELPFSEISGLVIPEPPKFIPLRPVQAAPVTDPYLV